MTHRPPCVPVWSDWTVVSVAEKLVPYSSYLAPSAGRMLAFWGRYIHGPKNHNLCWLERRAGPPPWSQCHQSCREPLCCGDACKPHLCTWCCLPSARAMPLGLVQRDMSAWGSRGVRLAPRTEMEVWVSPTIVEQGAGQMRPVLSADLASTLAVLGRSWVARPGGIQGGSRSERQCECLCLV